MSSIEVRPFHRRDRQQLADLVNAHAQAVVPGMGVSVSALLSELERQPGEFIVDPWVSERTTLVAEQRYRVAAAAHLLRYYADERAGRAYRARPSWGRLAGLRATAVRSWPASWAWRSSCRPTPPVAAMIVSFMVPPSSRA